MKMKNENQDLLELKIEIIDSGNTSIYQEIALLVDRPDYLRLISKVRQEYSIDEVVPAKGDFSYLLNLFDSNNEGEINYKKYKTLDKFKELLPKEFDNVMSFAKDTIEPLRAQAEAVLICFEFGRPYYFIPVILQSIMYGVADTNWLQRTQAVVQDQDYALYRFDEINIPQVVIEISPFSTETDIKKALREGKKIFKTDPRFNYFIRKPDYVNEIRKYRYWYWERLKGIKYCLIAKKWDNLNNIPDSCSTDELDVIRGVKKYTNLLQNLPLTGV